MVGRRRVLERRRVDSGDTRGRQLEPVGLQPAGDMQPECVGLFHQRTGIHTRREVDRQTLRRSQDRRDLEIREHVIVNRNHPLMRLPLLVPSLLLALAGRLEAQAPGPLTFQATLESIKIDAQPQQVVTRQFRLTLDPNQRETRFKAKVEDWWRSEDGKQSFYADAGSLRHSCARWVTLNPAEATARAGEPLIIRITVAVPQEIPPSGYWCALTVDQIPDPAAEEDAVGVRFVASVSTGIFVNVGTVLRSARILDVQVGQEEAVVKVRNDGNGPVGIDGRLEFFAAGTTAPVATVILPRATILTEPSLDGSLTARLPPPAELPAGRYRVRAVLDFGGAHYLGAEKEVDLLRPLRVNGEIR